MTTREIHHSVKDLFMNYEHKLFNSYLFDWESDFFAISKSGYSLEVEVKLTRADFKKDFTHKPEKHKMFANFRKEALCKFHFVEHDFVLNELTGKRERVEKSSYITFVKPADKLPNKFYFACPEGVIPVEEVPDYAGLIYVQNTDMMRPKYQIVKKAQFLHKQVNNFTPQLMKKYFWRNIEALNMLWQFKRNNQLSENVEKQINDVMNRLR
ncbi:hypothetical protein [Pedobacter sp. Leaf170]|uniref:hypothetical protein n=1 Tax=Pedobacter sp. Leaf170 TaxID=2876558 RepID=UPI001E482DE6|nr:hypothetical protein [Pedobacter sp. Leaf170]